jgi:hypothetical protein
MSHTCSLTPVAKLRVEANAWLTEAMKVVHKVKYVIQWQVTGWPLFKWSEWNNKWNNGHSGGGSHWVKAPHDSQRVNNSIKRTAQWYVHIAVWNNKKGTFPVSLLFLVRLGSYFVNLYQLLKFCDVSWNTQVSLLQFCMLEMIEGHMPSLALVFVTLFGYFCNANQLPRFCEIIFNTCYNSVCWK